MKTKLIFNLLLSLVILFTAFTFSVMAGENIAVQLNGENLSFDIPPQLINSRTMVPMRAVFEALGVVDWSENTNTVFLECDKEFISRKNENKTFMNDFGLERKPDEITQKRRYYPKYAQKRKLS